MDDTENVTVAAELPDNLVLTLRRPITFAKVEYAELRLTEPTQGQLEEADRLVRPMAVSGKLIQLNAKVPQGVVAQLSQRDFQAAMDFFNSFGAASPPGSET